MAPLRFRLVNILLIFLLFSCSAPKWPTENHYPHEVQATLQKFLPELNIAPDDPAFFDSDFDFDTKYCPQLSDPFWLIPSADLPEGVTPQNSNNNVTISIFDNRLFLAFRTGPTHFASEETGMYIISTADGKKWRKEMELFIGRDVREPFLIPIDGKLYFYCFGAGTNMTAFEPEFIDRYTYGGDGSWTGPESVLTKGEVHWSIKNRDGKTYMTSYSGSHYQVSGVVKVQLHFKQTDDGKTWSPVGDSSCVYTGGVSETAFEFDKEGNIWAVTRLEDGDKSGFGSHVAFAKNDNLGLWEFPESADNRCFMSPKLFRHGNEIYLIGRRQLGKWPFGRTKRKRKMSTQRLVNWVSYSLSAKTTALFRINKQERKVEWVMDLPGAGDTAFPSIIRLDKNRFLVANYTSPIDSRKRWWLRGQLGNTKIYLQLITFAPCDQAD